MEQLNPDHCEVLYLVCFENMSYAQAAQVMGKSIKQIDHLLERGKKKIAPAVGTGGDNRCELLMSELQLWKGA